MATTSRAALATAACVALLCALGPPSAAAALTLQCVPREAVFDRLKAATGEVPAYRGVTSDGALFEVLVSPDGTWTAFFTFPDGLTCPIGTGEGWRDVPATPVGPRA